MIHASKKKLLPNHQNNPKSIKMMGLAPFFSQGLMAFICEIFTCFSCLFPNSPPLVNYPPQNQRHKEGDWWNFVLGLERDLSLHTRGIFFSSSVPVPVPVPNDSGFEHLSFFFVFVSCWWCDVFSCSPLLKNKIEKGFLLFL